MISALRIQEIPVNQLDYLGFEPMGNAVLYGIVCAYIDILAHHPFKQLGRDGHTQEQLPEKTVEVVQFNRHVHRIVAARGATGFVGVVCGMYHYPGMPVNRPINPCAENHGTH